MAETLQQAVESSLGQVWVRGEVSGLKAHASGHWYFALRDPDAQVRCVMWRAYTARAGAPPADGTEVYILARPSLWTERGEVRLAAVVLLPTAAVGQAEAARERTRAALERDGLFRPERKRPLPPFPTAIAVVTSLAGAALHDLLTVRRARWPFARILVVPSGVQGEGAAAELVQALGRVAALPDVDLCILARGGGSREDLAVFDAEEVCRAVAAVPVPVIAAIGHETDLSLVDLVADHRAPTPSAAAEQALPDRRAVARHVEQLATRLAHGLQRPARILAERVARTGDRLLHAMERRVSGPRRDLERLAAQLDALSPLQVLQRGFAVPRDAAGRVLRRRADFHAALPFHLRVTDGDIRARVEETDDLDR